MPKSTNPTNEKDNALFEEIQRVINDGNNNYSYNSYNSSSAPPFTAPFSSEMHSSIPKSFTVPNMDPFGNPIGPGFGVPNMGPGFGGPIKTESKFTKDNEYVNLIKNSEYKLSETEIAIAKWHFRHNNGSSLALEVTDAANDMVKAKFTDEEWHFKIDFTHDEYVKTMTTLKDTINTIKLLTNGLNVPLEITSELSVCYKFLEKNLEKIYNRVIPNYYKNK